MNSGWSGDAEAVTVTIDGQQKETPVENGYAKAVFDLTDVHLWDGVDDPYLYTAKAELSDGDSVETTFGCRSFPLIRRRIFLKWKVLSASRCEPSSGPRRSRQCADK